MQTPWHWLQTFTGDPGLFPVSVIKRRLGTMTRGLQYNTVWLIHLLLLDKCRLCFIQLFVCTNKAQCRRLITVLWTFFLENPLDFLEIKLNCNVKDIPLSRKKPTMSPSFHFNKCLFNSTIHIYGSFIDRLFVHL